MRPWKIALIAVPIMIVTLGGLAYLWRGEIAVAVMKRQAERILASDPIAELPDGLHVGLCGAGSPFPDPTRVEPCVAVVAGRRLFVIDTGEGGAKNLQLMGLPPASVEAVLLTHFHSDHINGLGALFLQHWVAGSNSAPLPVYGPPGVETVVAGFNEAYNLDSGYRVAHHGPAVVPPEGFGGVAKPFVIGTDPAGIVVLDDGGVKIIAFPVDHRPVEPAVGYSFAYKGRKVVVSGDTVPTASVEMAAKGADVLVHEALAPGLVSVLREAALKAGRVNLAKILKDIVTYHTTPEQAAEIAHRAGVGFLLLHHIVPALPFTSLEGPFLGDARARFEGPIKVGHDGDFISLTAGGKAIEVTNRLR